MVMLRTRHNSTQIPFPIHQLVQYTSHQEIFQTGSKGMC